MNLLQITTAVTPIDVPIAAEPSMSLLELLMKGGWVMIPILFLSLIGIYVIIERMLVFLTYIMVISILVNLPIVNSQPTNVPTTLAPTTMTPTETPTEAPTEAPTGPINPTEAPTTGPPTLSLSPTLAPTTQACVDWLVLFLIIGCLAGGIVVILLIIIVYLVVTRRRGSTSITSPTALGRNTKFQHQHHQHFNQL